jgi:5S rRNA maturation endonuclease (ribonuclease M5)
MSCAEANAISIIDYLYSIGIEPKKVVGNNHWYLSPLREEKIPSFKVDSNLNRFYDFGLGIGGKTIDLLVRIHQINVAEVLEKLNANTPSISFSFQKPTIEVAKPVIKKVKALENKALLSYLTDRAIEPFIAEIFCKEIYYSIGDKNYFAIGFKNDLGGYEIRNKYFKGCIGGPKGITSIKRDTTNSWLLCEGVCDFLSIFQMGGIITDFSFIILNSVNQLPHAIAELEKHHTDYVISYFDNDEAGKKCFQNLKSAFPNAIDRSDHYAPYKDVNEMAIATMKNINKSN